MYIKSFSMIPTHEDEVFEKVSYFPAGVRIQGPAELNHVSVQYLRTQGISADYIACNGVSLERKIENVSQEVIERVGLPLIPLFAFPGIHTTKMCRLVLTYYLSNTPFVDQLMTIVVPWIAQQTSLMSEASETPNTHLVGLLFDVLPETKCLINDALHPLATAHITKKIIRNKYASIPASSIEKMIRIVTGAYGCLESTIDALIPCDQADDDYKRILTAKLTKAFHAMCDDITGNIIIDDKVIE